jgi:hypothetical protein|tara:strand:+ start:183 stop:320 length:138 start_codon:yes stop_codon:yes gene_type:complete
VSREAFERMTKRIITTSNGKISEKEARKEASKIAERHDRKRDKHQ